MDNINAWLESFPYRDAQTRLKALQVKKQEIDAELMRLMQLVAVYEHEHRPSRTQPEQPTEEVEPVRSLRLAIARVMRDSDRGMRLSELRDVLVERGWLTNTKNDYHRLQMAASNMVKAAQLKRPEQGLYIQANGAARSQGSLTMK
jgi:hypothetical protein